MKAYFTAEQQEQIRWEECLHSLFRYEFQKLKQQLKKWHVSPDQTLWALRKSGLCAEVGEYDVALSLLQNSLSNLRQRISHQTRPDTFLVSLESPMMKLQSYISEIRPSDAEEKNITFVDEHRRTVHRQYEVDWADENKYFTSRLEAHWVPFQTHETKPRFDFGVNSSTTHYGGEDKERIVAFTFLQFREETGIPFRLENYVDGAKAACGAAERIALYCPLWAILTVVRAGEEKFIENALTRGVLSTWTPKETDECCQFYIDAVLRTELEFTNHKTAGGNTFVTKAATVLLEALSELCSKCSDEMMVQLLDFLKKLYSSPQKDHYLQAASLVKRLIPFYPVGLHRELLLQLLTFPLPNLERLRIHRDLLDPFGVLLARSKGFKVLLQKYGPISLYTMMADMM